jgi:hypothetical protein
MIVLPAASCLYGYNRLKFRLIHPHPNPLPSRERELKEFYRFLFMQQKERSDSTFDVQSWTFDLPAMP